MKPLTQLATCLLFTLTLLADHEALAQSQTVQNIGTDPLKQERYDCVREADNSLNSIRVTTTNGKVKTLKEKAAVNRLKKRVRTLSNQRKRIARLKRNKERQLQKLQNKADITGKTRDKILRIREQLAKIDLRLAEADSRRATIQQIVNLVKKCKDPAPVSGNVQVVSGTFIHPTTGEVSFYARLVYILTGTPSGNLCALVSGHSEKVQSASGVYYAEPPFVSNLRPQKDRCIVRDTDTNECLDQSSIVNGFSVFILSMGGFQAPGSCDNRFPEKCSLSDAVALLNQRAGNMEIQILGTTAFNSFVCSQDLSDY